ncbi:hypothetical protein, partial [Actinomadura rubrisoli]|uniref:hypothetical protein n=1 Tax=Actinomadura rubrisoli TaxID=2530368 RepID=UPI001A9FDA4C
PGGLDAPQNTSATPVAHLPAEPGRKVAGMSTTLLAAAGGGAAVLLVIAVAATVGFVRRAQVRREFAVGRAQKGRGL